MLVEGNTGYGQQASNWKLPDKWLQPQHDAQQPVDLITIPFPLHISSLRGVAREDDPNPERGPAAPPVSRSLTHVNIRETFTSRATIPLMSQLENSSSEIVLSTLLENLEDEHVRYIGLVATDVRDRIFLAEQVRHHLPNSVLFTVNTDLLYAHPDKNVDLRGTQVVTTYSLFGANHDWIPSGRGVRRRLLFPTHTAQGVYSAAVALLDLPEQMQEYGYPFEALGAGPRWPLWVSIVGNNRLQPVKVLADREASDMVLPLSVDKRATDGVIPLPYHPWLPTLALVICVVPALFVFSSFAPHTLEFSIDRAGALVSLGRDLVRDRTPASLGSPLSVDAAKLLATERQIAEGAQHESAAVQEARETLTLNLSRCLPVLENHVLNAEHAFHEALNAEAGGDWRTQIERRTEAEQHLSLMSREVTKLVRPAWRLPSAGAPERSKNEPNEFQWFELAEDFLTSRVAAFLSHVVPQLQNLVVFVTAGLLMMLLAVTSYPFQPHQLLLLFNTTVILAIVGVTFVVFIQMERETILSVLSDSEPGRVNLNRDFVSRVVVYVGVPIISLLGAQFPEVAQQLFSWTSSFFGTH